MNLSENAQIIASFLQSGVIILIAGLLWKLMQQQVNAAKAAEDTKTQTLEALKDSHAGEIASLKSLIETLKEQRDFGKTAREIMESDVATLEREAKKWKKEAQQLKEKLEELQSKNKTQTSENQQLIKKLKKLKSEAELSDKVIFDDIMSGFEQNNRILVDTNHLLSGLTPSVIGIEPPPVVVTNTPKTSPKINLPQQSSPVIIELAPGLLKTLKKITA